MASLDGDAGQIGSRRIDRSSVLEPAHQAQSARAARRLSGRIDVEASGERHRHPHVRRHAVHEPAGPEHRPVGEHEVRRHDPDHDVVARPGDGDLPANHRAIAAVPALPERVAQNDFVRRRLAERTAENRRAAEQAKHAGAHRRRANLIRRRAVDVLIGGEEREHRLEIDEGLRVAREVDDVGRRQRIAIEAFVRVVAPDHDELTGVVVWQRPEEHVIDGGENRAARAEAERDREHRGGRRRGRSPQHAQCELHVSEPAF